MISLWWREIGEGLLKEGTFDIQLCLLGSCYMLAEFGDDQARTKQDNCRLQELTFAESLRPADTVLVLSLDGQV